MTLRLHPAQLSETSPARSLSRKTPASRTLLAAVTLLGGFFVGGNLAKAQSVTTEPVGVINFTLNPGINPVTFNLHSTPIARDLVASSNGSTITMRAPTIIGALLDPQEPYYIEVQSGLLKGDRFDVNVASTIALNNNAIVLVDNSPNNTQPVSVAVSNISNALISLRKHVTPEYIQSLFTSPLIGNNTFTNADQILIFNPETSGYIVYYLRGDGTTWRQAGSPTVVNKFPIPPSSGIFINKVGTSGSLTQIGSVGVNDFALKLTSGFQFVASPWPVALSPAKLNASQITGWSGNNTPNDADQILVYNTNTQGFDLYYLRADGTTWRRGGNPDNVTNVDIIPANTPFFIKKTAADPDFILQAQAIGL